MFSKPPSRRAAGAAARKTRAARTGRRGRGGGTREGKHHRRGCWGSSSPRPAPGSSRSTSSRREKTLFIVCCAVFSCDTYIYIYIYMHVQYLSAVYHQRLCSQSFFGGSSWGFPADGHVSTLYIHTRYTQLFYTRHARNGGAMSTLRRLHHALLPRFLVFVRCATQQQLSGVQMVIFCKVGLVSTDFSRNLAYLACLQMLLLLFVRLGEGGVAVVLDAVRSRGSRQRHAQIGWSIERASP